MSLDSRTSSDHFSRHVVARYPPRHLRSSVGTDSSHRLDRRDSSSTFNSYYDPGAVPLSISQQTSTSSMRDGALRRGASHMSYPMQKHSSRPGEVEALPQIKPTPLSPDSPKDKPRRRLSRLIPSFHLTRTLSSSSSNSKRQSPRSVGDQDYVATASHRPASFISVLSRDSDLNSNDSRARQMKENREEVDSVKMHVYRPQAGRTNWYDSFEETSESNTTNLQRASSARIPAAQQISDSASIRTATLEVLDGHVLRKSSVNAEALAMLESTESLPHVSEAEEELQTYVQIPRISPVQHVQDDWQSDAPSKHTDSHFCSQSVLALSDSDGSDHELQEPSLHHHVESPSRTRAYSTAPTVSPSPSLKSGSSPGSEYSRSKSRLRSIQPTMRQRSNLSTMESANYATHADVDVTSQSSRSTIEMGHSTRSSWLSSTSTAFTLPPTKTSQSHKHHFAHPMAQTSSAQLMAVTPEEAALLANIRRTRAAMQQRVFIDGYETGVQAKTTEMEIRRAELLKKLSNSPPPSRNSQSTVLSRPSTAFTTHSSQDLDDPHLDNALVFPDPPKGRHKNEGRSATPSILTVDSAVYAEKEISTDPTYASTRQFVTPEARNEKRKKRISCNNTPYTLFPVADTHTQPPSPSLPSPTSFISTSQPYLSAKPPSHARHEAENIAVDIAAKKKERRKSGLSRALKSPTTWLGFENAFEARSPRHNDNAASDVLAAWDELGGGSRRADTNRRSRVSAI